MLRGQRRLRFRGADEADREADHRRPAFGAPAATSSSRPEHSAVGALPIATTVTVEDAGTARNPPRRPSASSPSCSASSGHRRGSFQGAKHAARRMHADPRRHHLGIDQDRRAVQQRRLGQRHGVGRCREPVDHGRVASGVHQPDGDIAQLRIDRPRHRWRRAPSARSGIDRLGIAQIGRSPAARAAASRARSRRESNLPRAPRPGARAPRDPRRRQSTARACRPRRAPRNAAPSPPSGRHPSGMGSSGGGTIKDGIDLGDDDARPRRARSRSRTARCASPRRDRDRRAGCARRECRSMLGRRHCHCRRASRSIAPSAHASRRDDATADRSRDAGAGAAAAGDRSARVPACPAGSPRTGKASPVSSRLKRSLATSNRVVGVVDAVAQFHASASRSQRARQGAPLKPRRCAVPRGIAQRKVEPDQDAALLAGEMVVPAADQPGRGVAGSADCRAPGRSRRPPAPSEHMQPNAG